MSRAKVLGVALVVAAAIATAGPAGAQVTVGADVGLFSDYIWRGLTYTSSFVIEPDAYVTFPAGPASITVGGWANIEPGKYDGPTDISEGGGTSSFDLTEFDWWGELSYPVGVATLTGGVTGYIFPNDAGFTSDFNTVEIYGKVALGVPLNPKLAVWYDVDKVKGAYFEGSVSHTLHPAPSFPLTFGALMGVSAGQGSEPDAAGDPTVSFFNFHDDGVSHIDLSASSSFALGPLSIAPVFHFVINQDDLTHSKNLTETSDTKIWFGGIISWSRSFGGEEEAEAEAE